MHAHAHTQTGAIDDYVPAPPRREIDDQRTLMTLAATGFVLCSSMTKRDEIEWDTFPAFSPSSSSRPSSLFRCWSIQMSKTYGDADDVD